mmetsp:Transcript_134/g.316  ORF Transcript_134/g.316 Transcript_134/m.316 type:complete len:120 (+) Transcript_134:204-563(+)
MAFSQSNSLLTMQRPVVGPHSYCKHLPILSSVARRVVAQVVSASCAERNWSVYGQIMTRDRAAMKHQTSDKLVFCHEVIHIRDKVQDAAYRRSTIAWDESDSDTDSDASDDEDFSMFSR